ncbi:protein translocase subunit SecD [Bartonella sp. HY329]|uniref:protein translocase subunit SecD n=1 Tax=unclassified Bartonella TaxID=2645622 RepID=UPI0021C74B2B|nr:MULTISPECIES: protein translocase subunit SecD [unclassified Bartonella]UXM94055.1 protein translocase subunit SecD [Bartonella sp. HY329]UXN08377.1 protein translocase subunit SecD [Bartonella sp. HY328]
MLFFSVWKRVLIWAVILFGIVFALPNILPSSILSKLPSSYANLHLPLGIDLRGGSRIIMQLPKDDGQLRLDTIDVITRRLDQFNQEFMDYSVNAQSRQAIRVEVPGFFNVQELKDIVSVPANIAIYQEVDNIKAQDVITGKVSAPKNSEIFYDFSDPPVGYLINANPVILGENLVGASVETKAESDEADVRITLDEAGAQALDNFTKSSPNKRLFFIMDGDVIWIENNVKKVDAGYLDIGPVEKERASSFATLISSGPLPTAVTLIEERTIGADLGKDYASSGFKAAIGALLVVAIFMIISYGFLGVVADIALTANLALVITILSFIGVPLSLAGFAGLVLTIGVSVDAIILIYERIREDRRNGYSVTQALEAGFARAKGTIIDANITTLIAAVVLFLLGIGPIHGFALTVTVGIIVSLFTTLTFTRLMISTWVRYFKPGEVPARIFRIVPVNTRIAFMRIGKWTLSLACALIIATCGLSLMSGINYGIDFAGGSLAVLEAKGDEADANDVAERVENLNIGDVVITQSKNAKILYLTVPSQEMGEDADQSVAVKLRNEFSQDYQLQRMDVVGPQISENLSSASMVAVIISLIAIFGYVWLRFDWKFAIGAVVTTIHDVIILLFLFIVFQWQFNIWSIAAVLAIIGYSLNDTIVVYDRIRELLRKDGYIQITSLVDIAINRTLSRTLLTSLATLIAHIPLYYFGGTDMRDFASVLLLGIIIGTYSSIFIAGPLAVLLGIGRNKQIEYAEEQVV